MWFVAAGLTGIQIDLFSLGIWGGDHSDDDAGAGDGDDDSDGDVDGDVFFGWPSYDELKWRSQYL